jgi:hypothetical protein
MLFFFTSYFWEFFFDNTPTQNHFYEAAVWGNVIAILPLAIASIIAFVWHKGIVKQTHKKLDALAEKHTEHTEHLKKILDLLDPETDGGISVVHEKIDRMENELNLETPGGLKTILDSIKNKSKTYKKR